MDDNLNIVLNDSTVVCESCFDHERAELEYSGLPSYDTDLPCCFCGFDPTIHIDQGRLLD